MKKLIFTIIPILLISCNTPNIPNTNNNNNTNSNKTDNKLTLSISIIDGSNNSFIKGAIVKLISSNNGDSKSIKTDNEGNSVFNNVDKDAFYNIEVSAEGFIENKTNIKVDSNKVLGIKLYKTAASIKGKILSNNDTPIENSVIKVGNDFALSNEKGEFSLKLSSLDNLPLEIYKNGFEHFKIDNLELFREPNKNLGDIKLKNSNTKTSIYFDNRTNLLDYLSSLNDLLVNNNYEVKKGNFNDEDLSKIDILVLTAPNINYTSSEINKLDSFIRNGGKKLIILGEWGGYTYYQDSINSILKEFNLKINQDLVRDNSKFESNEIVTNYIQDDYITDNIKYLNFYSASSIEIIKGGINDLNTDFTKNLVYTSSDGFRIKDYIKGQQTLVASSLSYGTKLVLVGDTSIFTSDDSNSNGIININENDNKIFALNIFNW